MRWLKCKLCGVEPAGRVDRRRTHESWEVWDNLFICCSRCSRAKGPLPMEVFVSLCAHVVSSKAAWDDGLPPSLLKTAP